MPKEAVSTFHSLVAMLFNENGETVVTIIFPQLEPNRYDFSASGATWYGLAAEVLQVLLKYLCFWCCLKLTCYMNTVVNPSLWCCSSPPVGLIVSLIYSAGTFMKDVGVILPGPDTAFVATKGVMSSQESQDNCIFFLWCDTYSLP